MAGSTQAYLDWRVPDTVPGTPNYSLDRCGNCGRVMPSGPWECSRCGSNDIQPAAEWWQPVLLTVVQCDGTTYTVLTDVTQARESAADILQSHVVSRVTAEAVQPRTQATGRNQQ